MRVLVITRQNFSRLLGQSPEIQGKIMRSMADRLAANAL
jgi:CRP-like cAMP-binding protein